MQSSKAVDKRPGTKLSAAKQPVSLRGATVGHTEPLDDGRTIFQIPLSGMVLHKANSVVLNYALWERLRVDLGGEKDFIEACDNERDEYFQILVTKAHRLGKKIETPNGDRWAIPLSRWDRFYIDGTKLKNTVQERKLPYIRPRRVFTTPVITTIEALQDMVDDYLKHQSFAFDSETVGTREPLNDRDIPALDPHTNEVLWMSFARAGRADVLPLGHPGGPEQLTIEEALPVLKPLFFSGMRKIAHNIKFDLLSLSKYYGQVIPGPYFCTQTASYLVNENESHRLEDQVRKYFKFLYEKLAKKGTISSFPFNEAARYAYLDAKYDWLLHLKLIEKLKEDPRLLKLFETIEMPVTKALLPMERYGALLDLEMLEEIDKNLQRQMTQLQAHLFSVAGRPFSLTAAAEKGWFVYEVRGHKPKKFTPKQQKPSTDEEALGMYRRDPEVAKLMEWVDLHKLHSTYITAYKTRHDAQGRIRSNFNQTGAQTGRFSSSNPNLQNIPRPDDEDAERGALVRSLFIAPPGHKLIVADYEQQEYRVLAHYCQDPVLLRAFFDGVDVHRATAAILFNKDVGEVSAFERSVAKNVNFATVYGAGPEKVARMVTVQAKHPTTEATAKRFLDAHKERFPMIYQWTATEIRRARGRKPPGVRTLLGRYRRLPAIMAREWEVRGHAERQAVNTIIQGTSADLTKLAMKRVDEATENTPFQMILTVHDELVTVAPVDDVDRGVGLIRWAMEDLEKDHVVKLSVPLLADIKVVDRWSEAKG